MKALVSGMVAVATLMTLVSCATEPENSAASADAALVMQVASVYPGKDHTTVEGPVLAPDGRLYMVDATATAGRPKVLAVDLGSKETTPIYTDDTGAYSSAQISPADGRLYITDLTGGRILSMGMDGSDTRVFAANNIDGERFSPDDIAFDQDGNLFVTDMRGTPWEPDGRIIRFDVTGDAEVLARGLPSPNGISFTPDFSALWISLYTGGRVDLMHLSPDRRDITEGHTAIWLSLGDAQPDSTATDSAGNVYQAVHGRPEVRIYEPHGELIRTVRIPQLAESDRSIVANLAIRPGSKEAYVVVGGSDGGYVYSFTAVADGIPQSNGGGA